MQIAHAALPSYTLGDRLAEDQVSQVTDAVATLAQAGLSHDQVIAVIDEDKSHHGKHWREALWKRVLDAAGAREAGAQRVAA